MWPIWRMVLDTRTSYLTGPYLTGPSQIDQSNTGLYIYFETRVIIYFFWVSCCLFSATFVWLSAVDHIWLSVVDHIWLSARSYLSERGRSYLTGHGRWYLTRLCFLCNYMFCACLLVCLLVRLLACRSLDHRYFFVEQIFMTIISYLLLIIIMVT